ncbi:MAG: BamA/TamA family outer membrane protein [Acidobacteria bacterium]|nr:BamA/TamA family outer membrane protein [Acidobacteriota bacterium]
MTRPGTAVAALFVCLAASAAALAQPSAPSGAGKIVAGVRVHGNQLTTESEVVALAGLAIGAPFRADTIDRTRERLESAGRFRRVQVLERFASIDDPSQVLVVIVVDEGPLSVVADDDSDGTVRIARRRFANLLIAPILDGEEGYGLTYGVRLAWIGLGGERGRLSVPLAWGGWKRAGLEYDRTFEAGPLTRVQIGAGVDSRRNPAFDEPADASGGWARIERRAGPVRVAALAGWRRVRFAELDDRVRSGGMEVVLDTRIDPVLPRDAAYASFTLERLSVSAREPVWRTSLDARGYLGLMRQAVLVSRLLHDDASGPLPPYLQPLLGGWSSLRGFTPGSFVGDRLVAGSLELRVPLSSPLRLGRLGVSAFVDAGTTSRYGDRLFDQPLHTGVGGAVWFSVTAIQAGVGVAHAVGGGTRATFGASLRF